MSPPTEPFLQQRGRRKLLKFFEPSLRDHPDWPVIISEGDSWFSFPLHPNVVDQLDDLAGRRLSLLRLEASGEEFLSVMSGRQRAKLRKMLDRYLVQALLLSGGGNDIVGVDLLPLLRQHEDGMSWEDCIHKPRVERRIRRLEDAYHELVDIRDDYRPGCKIYLHGYDYAIPSGVPVRFFGLKLGPWLEPYLEERGILVAEDQRNIIRWLMDQFNTSLRRLVAERNDIIYIKTPGTLSDQNWNDELHPTEVGFRKVALKFKEKLAGQFPGTF